jgi:protein phosphatase
MRVAGKSHIGKVRDSNQDAFFVSLDGPAPLENLFIVADGMGGHSAGDVASARALEAFCDFVSKSDNVVGAYEDFMAEALNYANSEVYFQSLNKIEYRGMGTTFSAVSVRGGCLHYVHVGDSRVYLVGGQGLKQVTTDHSSLTADMVAQGLIDAEEAKKYPRVVLSRAIGTDEEVRIDKGFAEPGEDVGYILICSDGLTNMLGDKQIFEIFDEPAKDAGEICERLVQGALNAGGSDNISVIVIGWDNK